MPVTALAIAAGCVLLVSIALARRRRADDAEPQMGQDAVIIGMPQVEAVAAERRRLAEGPTDDSLLPEERYRRDAGDFDLYTIEPRDLDDRLAAIARSFAESSEERRARIRASIDLAGLNTLLWFARRMSALALVESSTTRCRDGLLGLAMVDPSRLDMREAAWSAGLLGCVTRMVGGTDALFDEAISIAEPDIGALLRPGSSARTSELAEWGYARVETAGGRRLVRSDGLPYAPTFDLTRLTSTFARAVVEGDRYTAEVEIGASIPLVWFSAGRRDEADAVLAASLATACIEGTPRSHLETRDQMFRVWIVETRDATAAESLVGSSGAGLPGRFVASVSRGSLFGMVVAGSVATDVEPLESPDRVRDIADALRDHLASAGADRPGPTA